MSRAVAQCFFAVCISMQAHALGGGPIATPLQLCGWYLHEATLPVTEPIRDFSKALNEEPTAAKKGIRFLVRKAQIEELQNKTWGYWEKPGPHPDEVPFLAWEFPTFRWTIQTPWRIYSKLRYGTAQEWHPIKGTVKSLLIKPTRALTHKVLDETYTPTDIVTTPFYMAPWGLAFGLGVMEYEKHLSKKNEDLIQIDYAEKYKNGIRNALYMRKIDADLEAAEENHDEPAKATALRSAALMTVALKEFINDYKNNPKRSWMDYVKDLNPLFAEVINWQRNGLHPSKANTRTTENFRAKPTSAQLAEAAGYHADALMGMLDLSLIEKSSEMRAYVETHYADEREKKQHRIFYNQIADLVDAGKMDLIDAKLLLQKDVYQQGLAKELVVMGIEVQQNARPLTLADVRKKWLDDLYPEAK